MQSKEIRQNWCKTEKKLNSIEKHGTRTFVSEHIINLHMIQSLYLKTEKC